jgi:hypothetical protein
LLLAKRLKRFPRLGISHRTARKPLAAAPRHTAQVLQSAADFQGDHTSRHAMQPKRLQPRSFSQAAARFRPQSAFGLPQAPEVCRKTQHMQVDPPDHAA